MKWKPAKDILICKRYVVEEKVGGLIIPDQPKKINHMWTVVRAGNDVAWAEGETVILDGLGGLTLELDGEEHKIVSVKHVVAVMEHGT